MSSFVKSQISSILSPYTVKSALSHSERGGVKKGVVEEGRKKRERGREEEREKNCYILGTVQSVQNLVINKTEINSCPVSCRSHWDNNDIS